MECTSPSPPCADRLGGKGIEGLLSLIQISKYQCKKCIGGKLGVYKAGGCARLFGKGKCAVDRDRGVHSDGVQVEHPQCITSADLINPYFSILSVVIVVAIFFSSHKGFRIFPPF